MNRSRARSPQATEGFISNCANNVDCQPQVLTDAGFVEPMKMMSGGGVVMVVDEETRRMEKLNGALARDTVFQVNGRKTLFRPSSNALYSYRISAHSIVELLGPIIRQEINPSSLHRSQKPLVELELEVYVTI